MKRLLRIRAIRLGSTFGLVLAMASIAILARSAEQEPSAKPEPRREYSVLFEARLSPTEGVADARIEIGRGAKWVKHLRFSIDPERHHEFQGDGEVVQKSESVEWTPPETGGSLFYRFKVDHLRDERSYDSRLASNWAVLRGGRLFPPAKIRIERGALSRSRLRLRLPEGWSAVVPYGQLAGGDFVVNNPDRSFDRPTGWFVLGSLGVVREEIEGVKVAVAGPVQHGLRRLDILALLRWTMPELRQILGELPERLVVVGANDPMWRGGLSGPDSVFLHASRPLLTEDGTSPLLHEVIHTLTSARASDADDALVEGIAEYYSLELLRRSGTLSEERYAKAIARVTRKVGNRGPSSAARGVLWLRKLASAIEARSGGERSLDDVLRVVAMRRESMSIENFRSAADEATGLDLQDLFRKGP